MTQPFTGRRLLTALFVASLSIAMMPLVPSAAAHYCHAEHGSSQASDCETKCTAGEEHDHEITHHHENGWEDDVNHIHYKCKSVGSGNDEDCSTPRVLGICIVDRLVKATEIDLPAMT